jgi:hypothetical protein
LFETGNIQATPEVTSKAEADAKNNAPTEITQLDKDFLKNTLHLNTNQKENTLTISKFDVTGLVD